jgi:hypothetical protein
MGSPLDQQIAEIFSRILRNLRDFAGISGYLPPPAKGEFIPESDFSKRL